MHFYCPEITELTLLSVMQYVPLQKYLAAEHTENNEVFRALLVSHIPSLEHIEYSSLTCTRSLLIIGIQTERRILGTSWEGEKREEM